MKKEKGISLISLVVTIIILLILASITIITLFGDNGIIKKAEKAKDEVLSKQEEEKQILKQYEDLINQFTNNENKKISSLFSWDLYSINYSDLKSAIDYLNINTVYMKMDSEDFNVEEFQIFSGFIKQNNTEMYLLYDDTYESEAVNSNKIISVIDDIYEYNQNAESKITGISIDIEFYLTDEYKNATDEEKVNIFNDFVNCMKTSYEYAKTKQLKFAVCIPIWLDSVSEQELEELIKDGCDYAQLMNYTKDTMLEGISKEIELAKKYNKQIENIAELQAPNDNNSVTDEDTFYNDGIEACLEKFNQIEQKYNYNNLGFSYHYYPYIVELIGRIVDLTKQYDYELYLYDENGDPINIKNAYLIKDDRKYYGIPAYVESTNEYILEFYGLELSEEYKLVIEDEGYTTDKTVKYTVVEDKKEYSLATIYEVEKYTLELYGWSNGKEISISSGKLISGDDVIEGQLVEIEASTGETINIIRFNNLEYDKEYTVEAEAEGYEIVSGQTYIYTDKDTRLFYDDVYFE